MAGKGLAARAGLLAPLALLTLLVASALVVIASIILDHIIDNDTSGQGCKLQLIAMTHYPVFVECGVPSCRICTQYLFLPSLHGVLSLGSHQIWEILQLCSRGPYLFQIER
jgi:hypothetical protein